MKSIKSTPKILSAILAPVLLANCGQAPSGPSEASADNQAPAVVKSTLVLGKVGALSKGSAINLQKLILTAVSASSDTVRDTSTVSGNSQVTVQKTLTLKPMRNWTLSAKTLDLKDSVIHSGSSSAFYVKNADTVDVSLNLTSRFTMYEARFNALPDSISSTNANTGKEKLNINRVVLKVDGVIKADSSVAGFYAAGQSVNVFFDYITPGSHTVTLEAYGVLNQFSGKLYSGASTFNVAAGIDDTQAVTLNWVGPATGSGKLTVIIGKVGKLVINGGLPGAVIN